jgi:hypothetical protein
MGTWGVVKQAHDTMKQNRALLGRKRTARDLYREEIEKYPTTLKGATLEGVRERVEARIKRNRVHSIASKFSAVFFLGLLFLALAWMVMKIEAPKVAGKYAARANLFHSQVQFQSDHTAIMTEYFPGGPIAAKHTLLRGKRDGLSESYYETGELFRSALYSNDTILLEAYFYKSRDTISTFPIIRNLSVYTISVTDTPRKIKASFDFYDGKIIGGSYKEVAYPK